MEQPIYRQRTCKVTCIYVFICRHEEETLFLDRLCNLCAEQCTLWYTMYFKVSHLLTYDVETFVWATVLALCYLRYLLLMILKSMNSWSTSSVEQSFTS